MSTLSLPTSIGASRLKAFAVHLLLSVIAFSTLVAVMLIYWFPGKLFFIDGGWQGLQLVAMVDLVLGPALTLIVYKPGKPGLVKDLAIIATIQLAALAYGFYTTYQQRTVALVFAENKFATVSARDKTEADSALVERGIEPRELPAAGAFDVPQYLTPAHPNLGKYIAEIFNGYPSAFHRSDRYLSLQENHEQIRQHARSIDDLQQSGALSLISDALDKRSLRIDEVEVYRLTARYGDGYAVLDPAQGRVVAFVIHEVDGSTTAVAEDAG